MGVYADLLIDSSRLKSLREALCLAQTHPSGLDTQQSALIQLVIAQIDRHRPLGPDGKHGNRHTFTCGCDDEQSITVDDGISIRKVSESEVLDEDRGMP